MRSLLDPRARRVTLLSVEGLTGLCGGLAVVPSLWLVCHLAVWVGGVVR